LAFLARDASGGRDDHAAEPTPIRSASYSRLARAAFWGFGVSGALSLAYEITWSRVLAILFDSTIYGFILMLATVLFGIALGSALGGAAVTRWPSVRFAGAAFGWLEVGIGAAAVLSIATFGVANDVLRDLAQTDVGVALLIDDTRVMAALCVLTALPASLMMGATFPVAARLWAAGANRLGARLGGVYAANVTGAILGSLAGGFVLVPMFGAHVALLALAASNVALGVWLLWVSSGRRLAPAAALAGLAIVVWGAVQPSVHTQVFGQRYPGQNLLWYDEGLENTVSIARGPTGIRTLFTNSRGQSNDEHDLVAFYRTIGHLPALLAPQPMRVLVVGMGSGVTAGAIAEHPGSQVHIIELSDGMIAAAPHFAITNGDLVNRANVHITMDDGRNFLLRERGTFDLVAADVIHPYDAGSNNLYAVEYFRLVARSLSPNGVVLQWVSPVSEFEYKLIVRTFLEAFPHVTLWGSGDLLVGSLNPVRVDEAELNRRLSTPALRPSLEALNLHSVDQVLGRFHADTAELRAYVGPGPVLSDELPIFDYFYPLRTRTGPAKIENFSRDPSKLLAVAR
jgi:spermidine synthase